MKKPKLFLLLILFCGFFPLIFTNASELKQSITVTGVIVDATDTPVPGATIVIQGTTQGTTSDIDGKFSINVPSERTVLLITFIGYQPQTITVGNQRILRVVMDEATTELDEVVVVAYGIQKKVSVTAAISTVQNQELLKSSSVNLANSLAGRVSGLSSMQTGGGQPGKDDATMYLRGAATTNGKSPLILIDGVPRDNIRTLDPNEVESVSILKDASATAVFGVRGANGVILITTRRGTEGKAQLSINAYQSFTSFTKEPKYLSSVEYLHLRNQAYVNDGNAAPYSQEVIDKYANPLAGLNPSDPDYAQKAAKLQYMYPSHDYYRELIRKYTPQTTVNANLNGGTEKISYFINVGYVHQGGNLKVQPESELGYDPEVKMDRYSFRTNLDYKVTKSLKAFLNLGTYIEKLNMPSAGTYGGDAAWMMRDIIYQATCITPITPGPVTIAGYSAPEGQVVYPSWMDRTAYEVMNRQGYRVETRANLNSTLGMDWDLSGIVTEGLSVKGMLSYDSYVTSALNAHKNEYLYDANINTETNDLSFSRLQKQSETRLSVGKAADSRYTINAQLSVNYNRTFSSVHNIGAMILAQRDYWEKTSGVIPYNVLGIAARVTYNYDNRYFGEFNMGYNGSEQFSPQKRFGFFPAVSLGWALSNESFLENNNVITYLKLRGSYGQVGNDKMGEDRFLYQDQLTANAGGGYSGSIGKGGSVTEGLIGNPVLTWEIANKFNVGFDFRFFKELTGSVDFFIEKRDQILITRRSVPVFQGIPINFWPRQNMGKVDNKGFEIELNYNKAITQGLTVFAKGNFGFNKNTVKFMDEVARSVDYTYRKRSEGFSLNQQWGHLINYDQDGGYWTAETLADPNRIQYAAGAPREGDFVYVDTNKDGVIDDKDLAPIGNTTIPGITYGFNVGADFKGFDFTIFFQGAARYSSFSGVEQNVYEYIKQGTYYDYHRNAWTKERFANGEKITYPALSVNKSVNHRANSFFIDNRSFIRLKNLEFGYTLPAQSLQVIGVSKLRIYVSGENLVTWDKRTVSHLDPEMDDPIKYPITKMMNFGLNITF